MSYLIVPDAARFLRFVKDVFGAALTVQHLREDRQTIMHAEVNIQGSTLMFAHATDEFRPQTAGLFVYVDDADAAFARALAAGGTVVTNLSDQPYGRSGGVQDTEGNTWWITAVL